MKFETGKLGRTYLAGLWLSAAALSLTAFGIGIFRGLFDRAEWYGGAVLLGAGFMHGVVAYGILRRQSWSYYFSLLVGVYWVLLAIHDFLSFPGSPVPRWLSAVCFVLGMVALAWLASPSVRWQFPSAFHGKTRVVKPC